MLTPHQEEKRQSLTEILKKENFAVLEGSAGVGKTYMVNEFISMLPKELKKGNIVCAAPTHKALAVLVSKIDTEESIKFKTLDSLLCYRAVTNNKTGKREFVSKPNPMYPPLEGVGLLIIDEASMVGVQKHIDLCKYAEREGTKVLMIGDVKQLNPVKEEDSPVFMGLPEVLDKGLYTSSDVVSYEDFDVIYTKFPTVTLTEIIRQGEGNPIIDFSRNLDKRVQSDLYDAKEDENGNLIGLLATRNYNKVLEELALENGTDNVKFIAWSNKEVDSVNKLVRKIIYGSPNKIEKNESIVFNSPYGEDYKTNQELKVNTLEVINRPFKVIFADNSNIVKKDIQEVTFKIYLVNRNEIPVIILHEDSEKEFAHVLKVLRANARERLLNFTTLNTFLDLFADFKYNHAMTVHKSQGSSFKKAIVYYDNIMLNRNEKERKRLLYTAVTRASELLILYKNNF